MNAGKIFKKTMPFVWLKLVLGLATVVVSAVLFAILVGIGALFGDVGIGITFLIWLGLIGVVRFFFHHYLGYLVKAGHIAVITEAVTTGQVPADQVAVGKKAVLERFGTSNVYFVIDKLVAGAVKQLQNALGKVGDLLGGVPGVDAVVGIGQMFIGISLGYIDECCLGYTFYKKEQNAYQSAADGVVIYAQNWKTLLKSAAKTTAMVILLVAAVTIISFAVFGGIFTIFNWNRFAAFVLALLVAFAVKYAFIDSWILVKMMVSYMEVAPSTKITFDLYGKLCKLSTKFKELFNKAPRQEPVYAVQNGASAASTAAGNAAEAGDAKYCPACGAGTEDAGAFCGKCGARL